MFSYSNKPYTSIKISVKKLTLITDFLVQGYRVKIYILDIERKQGCKIYSRYNLFLFALPSSAVMFNPFKSSIT